MSSVRLGFGLRHHYAWALRIERQVLLSLFSAFRPTRLKSEKTPGQKRWRGENLLLHVDPVSVGDRKEVVHSDIVDGQSLEDD